MSCLCPSNQLLLRTCNQQSLNPSDPDRLGDLGIARGVSNDFVRFCVLFHLKSVKRQRTSKGKPRIGIKKACYLGLHSEFPVSSLQSCLGLCSSTARSTGLSAGVVHRLKILLLCFRVLDSFNGFMMRGGCSGGGAPSYSGGNTRL